MSYITTVRARLLDADPAAAMARHNGIVARLRPRLEPMGGTAHMVFARSDDPQEFLAVDRWETLEALQGAMGDPATQQDMGSLFDGPPDVTVWAVRDGWSAY